MKKKLSILLVAIVACATIASAQGRRGLRINEVMVQNDSSVVDDYGNHVGWVELFNSTFAPLEISSVYLTDDPQVPKKYPVPLGDVNTEIPSRQHVLFWADGNPTRGTFHLSFTLKTGKDNWIGIYDADGLTLIDSVTVPASLQPDQSYARAEDGVDNADASLTWQVRDNITDSTYITPSSNNVIKDTNTKIETFAEKDKNGFAMTIMAMCIVFSALLLLCVSFYIISKIGERESKSKKAKSHGSSLKELPKSERPDHDSGETIAAIAMALHEHLNAHDTENTVLTINKVKRAYSPWSSKIYSIRELPHR